MDVKKIPFRELRIMPGFDETVKEYCETFHANPFGVPAPNLDAYEEEMPGVERLECLAVLTPTPAEVVGICFVMIAKSNHLENLSAFIDSMYLRKAFRKGLTGVRLVKEACNIAKEAGATGICLTAPPGSRYEGLCKALGMRDVRHIYFRGFYERRV